MALILARKIHQYRSIVSILLKTIQISPRPGAKAYSKDNVKATQFPTGPALPGILPSVRHHKAAGHRHPLIMWVEQGSAATSTS